MGKELTYNANSRNFNVDAWKNKRTKYATGIQLRTARILAKVAKELENRLETPEALTTKELISIAKVSAENLQRLSVIEQYYDGTRDPNKDGSGGMMQSWQIIINQADDKLRQQLENNAIIEANYKDVVIDDMSQVKTDLSTAYPPACF